MTMTSPVQIPRTQTQRLRSHSVNDDFEILVQVPLLSRSAYFWPVFLPD